MKIITIIYTIIINNHPLTPHKPLLFSKLIQFTSWNFEGMFRTSSHRSAVSCSQVTASVSSWAAPSKDHVTHSLWSWGCCCQWTATWRLFVAGENGWKMLKILGENPTQGPNPSKSYRFLYGVQPLCPIKMAIFLVGGKYRHFQTEPISQKIPRGAKQLLQCFASLTQPDCKPELHQEWWEIVVQTPFPCGKVVKPRTNSKTLKIPTQGYQPPPYIIKLGISGLVFSISLIGSSWLSTSLWIVPPQKARSPQPSFLGKLRTFPNQTAKFWSILRGWFPHEFP